MSSGTVSHQDDKLAHDNEISFSISHDLFNLSSTDVADLVDSDQAAPDDTIGDCEEVCGALTQSSRRCRMCRGDAENSGTRPASVDNVSECRTTPKSSSTTDWRRDVHSETDRISFRSSARTATVADTPNAPDSTESIGRSYSDGELNRILSSDEHLNVTSGPSSWRRTFGSFLGSDCRRQQQSSLIRWTSASKRSDFLRDGLNFMAPVPSITMAGTTAPLTGREDGVLTAGVGRANDVRRMQAEEIERLRNDVSRLETENEWRHLYTPRHLVDICDQCMFRALKLTVSRAVQTDEVHTESVISQVTMYGSFGTFSSLKKILLYNRTRVQAITHLIRLLSVVEYWRLCLWPNDQLLRSRHFECL